MSQPSSPFPLTVTMRILKSISLPSLLQILKRKKLESMYIPTKGIFGYEVRNWRGDVVRNINSRKYVTARPFNENLAAVATEKDRGSLYYINQYGYRVFVNMRTYLNEHRRYVNEYIMEPLTKGIESIGHYYFENGIVRVRKQVIDYWNYESNERVRVVKDYDCLIRVDGSEISLPAGYTLEGYSDGMAILSKNGVYGVYDVTGQWIAQPLFADAKPFMSGLCSLTLPDGRCGMIDRMGNVVLPFAYESISSVSSGLVAAYSDENGWEIFTLLDEVPEEKAE